MIDRGVSRHHARLSRGAGGGFVIEDLSSRNGTLVNGQPITSSELRSGARIQIGPRCLLLFSLYDELQESMLDAKKVEIIGRLSAGINHDFNNLLCVIMANAAYLLELPRESSLAHAEVRECLEDMRAAAQAGAEVTNRLATLAQNGGMAMETIDLSKLCHETIAILRDTFSKSIRIEEHVQPGICVRGIRSHLRQLLLNPCLNARDAMPDGGALSIEVVLKSKGELEVAPMMQAQSYVIVTFRDTGTGMPPEVMNAAFEPFFTTKEIDLGRGLGLVAVRKVASDLGGTAELQSEVGKGTTLRVVLPVSRDDLESVFVDRGSAERAALRVETASPSEALTSDSIPQPPEAVLAPARVLLVEGDGGLARALARGLRRAGYLFEHARDADDAAARLASTPAQTDVVLLDLDAPSSAETCRALRERAVTPAVIGYCAQDDRPDAEIAAQRAVDHVVRKPIDPAMLARVIALALRHTGRSLRP
jgi:signal transduction histidine kinase/CheY-like chemotaxis protein